MTRWKKHLSPFPDWAQNLPTFLSYLLFCCSCLFGIISFRVIFNQNTTDARKLLSVGTIVFNWCNVFWNDPTDRVPVNNFGKLSEPLTYNTPAAAMCSLVRIGWKPTKGTCIDMRRPMMKKVVYAKNNTVKLINKNNFIRYIITKQWDSISTWMHHTILLNTKDRAESEQKCFRAETTLTL